MFLKVNHSSRITNTAEIRINKKNCFCNFSKKTAWAKIRPPTCYELKFKLAMALFIDAASVSDFFLDKPSFVFT